MSIDTNSGYVRSDYMESLESIGQGIAPKSSYLDLFLSAEPFVQGIMILLLLSSLWVWTVLISKLLTFRKLNKRTKEFQAQFWQHPDMGHESLKAYASGTPLATIVRIFEDARNSGKDVLISRFGLFMDETEEEIKKNLTSLSVIGSTALLVGLLGTVWGIIHSFQAIALAKNTSLAVVAPGIAEALLATALGLMAAIPAVVGYNIFLAKINRFMNQMDAFAQRLLIRKG